MSACTIIVRLWSIIFITPANGGLRIAWSGKVEHNYRVGKSRSRKADQSTKPDTGTVNV